MLPELIVWVRGGVVFNVVNFRIVKFRIVFPHPMLVTPEVFAVGLFGTFLVPEGPRPVHFVI